MFDSNRFRDIDPGVRILMGPGPSDVAPRVLEAMACGTFLLTNQLESGHKEMGFVDGTHFVFYNNVKDLEGKVEYFLGHDKEREEIASNGMSFVRTHHNNRVRAREFGETVKNHLRRQP